MSVTQALASKRACLSLPTTGHLEFLEAVGDSATGLPIGSSRQNLAAAVAGETHEYTDMYPGMAKSARQPLSEGARRTGRLTRCSTLTERRGFAPLVSFGTRSR